MVREDAMKKPTVACCRSQKYAGVTEAWKVCVRDIECPYSRNKCQKGGQGP